MFVSHPVDQSPSQLVFPAAQSVTMPVIGTTVVRSSCPEVAVTVARERDSVAQANLDAGMRLYREGLGTGLEVSTLNADRDEAAAELLRAELRRDLARVDLLEAVGADPLDVFVGR